MLPIKKPIIKDEDGHLTNDHESESSASGMVARVVMVTLLDSSPLCPSVVRGTTHISYSVPDSNPVRLYRGSELLMDTRN